MTLLLSQRMEREGSPSHLRNEGAFKGLSIQQIVDEEEAGHILPSTLKCLLNSRELLRVANNLLLFFQRHGTFFDGGGSGGATVIGEGDGALEDVERLIRCSKITVKL